MGSKKKNKTKIVQKKTRPAYTGNSSASARNIPKKELGGVIFVCSNATKEECFRKGLFGLPESHYSYVKKIAPGLLLFLFNYSDRRLHGTFEASSYGQLNIDPSAWTASGSGSTPFPAQVKFHVLESCQPLAEDQFYQILAEKNYYKDKHFWLELDQQQTIMLVSLFYSLPDRSSTTSVTVKEEVMRRNNRANAHWNEQASKHKLDFPQVEEWEDLVDDPQPNSDEHKFAESSSQKLWSALFKNEVPIGETKESKDRDYNFAVGECNLEFDGTSNALHCFDTMRDRLETIKEKELLEEEHLSSDSQHESSFSSPGVTASIEALLGDDQLPAREPSETEMKSSDLLNTVFKLSQELEEMKLAYKMQSDKIRSLEEKLDKSEFKVKKVEEWFIKLKSTFTLVEDEHDSIW